ncbi:Gp19/Gp15/Gp42 family protein [Mycolicibacterium houstonense]|uniref:Gp19/Gp15/Gp42 family protein n=1 Tax=Mycolicibacterium houstonense TaxID=146021 RepID=UPI003F9DE49C
MRLVRNPEAFASESDGNCTYRFDQNAASGNVEILSTEWDTLGIRPSKIFAIMPNPVRPR